MCVQLLYTFPIDNFYKIADQMIDFDCYKGNIYSLELKIGAMQCLAEFLVNNVLYQK